MSALVGHLAFGLRWAHVSSSIPDLRGNLTKSSLAKLTTFSALANRRVTPDTEALQSGAY